MGGERAQEMHNIWDPPASETSIYFATHTCKKTQAVVQDQFSGNKARNRAYLKENRRFSAHGRASSEWYAGFSGIIAQHCPILRQLVGFAAQ
jgi:hypothetical protein